MRFASQIVHRIQVGAYNFAFGHATRISSTHRIDYWNGLADIVTHCLHRSPQTGGFIEYQALIEIERSDACAGIACAKLVLVQQAEIFTIGINYHRCLLRD